MHISKWNLCRSGAAMRLQGVSGGQPVKIQVSAVEMRDGGPVAIERSGETHTLQVD